MDQLNAKLRVRLQITLFVVFLTIFVATSVLTLLALFGNFGGLSSDQKDLLVKATVLEVAAGVIALFFAIFGLRAKSESTKAQPAAETLTTPDVDLSSQSASETRRDAGQVLSNIADSSAQPNIHTLVAPVPGLAPQALITRKTQAVALAVLLRDLGLITIEANGRIQLVSDLAGCFIRSIATHLEENLDFIGGWTEHGRENPKAQIPRTILRAIEERRVGELGLEVARPIRSARSALVIVKAGHINGEDVFLLQLSDSWGGPYYWFIGGLMESQDRNLHECALRELNEELALTKADVLSLNPICKVPDRRISERLGAFTDYSYEVFHAALVSEANRVQALRNSTFELETFHGMAKFKRVNRWKTWDEIEADHYMQQHAAQLLSALRPRVHNLPYSVGWKVE